MPVKPQFTWEQTTEEVLLSISIKGHKKEQVDVFIADVFFKVNAPPTYLLALDLLHPITPEKSTFYYKEEVDGTCLCVKLHKAASELIWEALCVDQVAMGKKELMERRQASMQKAEARYRGLLESRVAQRESEQRRMLEEQWSVEKQQRARIEEKVKAEKTEAEADLYAWADHAAAAPSPSSSSPQETKEGEQRKNNAAVSAPPAAKVSPASPGEIGGYSPATTTKAEDVAPPPAVRQADTVHISIDFTPQRLAMPTRSRGDDAYYQQSRYKPVSIEDSPMFWKERADKHYHAKEWKAASDAYGESIKRDGVFMTCVMNRAACSLHLGDYKRAVEDCSLALTMLSNTPASEVTQDRYRYLMTKLHARRGAAYCWDDQLVKGAADFRMAAAFRDAASDLDVDADVALVEALLQKKGIVADGAEEPHAAAMQEASTLYYKGDYAGAEGLYTQVLAADVYHVRARSNLIAVLLHQEKFKEALRACEEVIEFCSEVAAALDQPGGLSSDQVDSDDEDEDEDDGPKNTDDTATADRENQDGLVRQHRAAAKKLSEQSGHVYTLLKAYVRGAAALCGLKEYQKAYVYLERALRITPYDNDLREDCNRIGEKVRMEVLLAASSGKPETNATAASA